MSKVRSAELGTDSIDRLLFKQALPSAIGILVMSLNIVIDTIFVGNWIGSTAIGAINVVLPVYFFISALGMAIGVGGGSVMSRALGAEREVKGERTYGIVLKLYLIGVGLKALVVALFVE